MRRKQAAITMQRFLYIFVTLCALAYGVCAAAEVYPAGIVRDGSMQGVYGGADAGSCCWLAPRASFTVVEPPRAEVLLLAFAIPPYALRASKAHVTISVDGAPAQTLCCFGVGSNETALAVRPIAHTRDVTVRVNADNVFVPKERGINQDPRKLTILLQSVAFQNTALGVRYVNGVSETMAPAVYAHRGLALALAFAAGLAALLLTLWRARFAWLALLIAAPVSLAVYVGGTTVTVDKAVLVGAALGMLCTPHRWRALRSTRFYWLGGALALTIVSMGISTLFAAHVGAAVRTTLMAVEYLVALGVAYAAYSCDRDESLLRNVLAIEVIVVALIAFAQIITGAPQGMFPGVRTHANNQLLQALCEQGLIGLAALVALIAVTFRAFARDTRVIGLAAFAMVLGFWSHEVFDTLLLYPKVGIAYWVVIGIILVAAALPPPEVPSAFQNPDDEG